jgi:class 3 adenylate cyclase
MHMQESQRMELIDLSEAPNDDVTYLGASFNSLSSSIDNLMTIFRSFVSQDVVQRAYKEREIRLEGTQRDLTILFTDIKGFTYMTETLGNDIIALLNLHYDRAIRRIHEHYGIVGSNIGDALLPCTEPWRPAAQVAGGAEVRHEIQAVAQSIRVAMNYARSRKTGARRPNAAELKVYRAVLQKSASASTAARFLRKIAPRAHGNTVIGDTSTRSRLEGLTPVSACRNRLLLRREEDRKADRPVQFVEFDTFQVKGKLRVTKLFTPSTGRAAPTIYERYDRYSKGLKAYYEGRWDEARLEFASSGVMAASVFLQRIEGRTAPADWSGVWTMESK